jgi:hypothetical protein
MTHTIRRLSLLAALLFAPWTTGSCGDDADAARTSDPDAGVGGGSGATVGHGATGGNGSDVTGGSGSQDATASEMDSAASGGTAGGAGGDGAGAKGDGGAIHDADIADGCKCAPGDLQCAMQAQCAAAGDASRDK